MLNEYYRVLKPNGIILTHNIAIINRQEATTVIDELSNAINMKVTPLSPEDWYQLYQEAGFQILSLKYPLSLMTPIGMIRDEGLLGTLKLLKRSKIN